MSTTAHSVTPQRRLKEPTMGEVRSIAHVKNPLQPDRPALSIDACVDTGAVMLLLGREVVEQLALDIVGLSKVILADDSEQQMERAGPVYIEIDGRGCHADCLVGPEGCEPLIGQIILENLDLIVDCSRQRVTPRPDSPAVPSYKMK